nr:PREDICTED: uncharacterized protein LOC108224483 isoform X2 [Daucus carota subsp. sativus]
MPWNSNSRLQYMPNAITFYPSISLRLVHHLIFSTISLEVLAMHQVPVRLFRHNEYERFLTTPFPYYGASFTTMVAFFLASHPFITSEIVLRWSKLLQFLFALFKVWHVYLW